MAKTNPRLKIYVLCVLVLALGFLSAQQTQSFEGRFQSPVNVMLWMALISIVSMSPIPRAHGRSVVVMFPALDLASILLFGTGIACWFGILSRLLSNTAERWTPLWNAVLKLGQAVLAIGAAGWVYERLGGTVGPGIFDNKEQILLALLISFIYILVNRIVWVLGFYWSRQSLPSFNWLGEAKERTLTDMITLPFGALLALTQLMIGSLGVALFLIPLLLARHAYKLWIEMKKAHLETVRLLMNATDAMDPFTRGHSYRISKMCVAVGRRMDMGEGGLEQLEYAALLHDIGRTAIQHDLLVKPGKLTEREHSVLRAHPRIGAEILNRLKFFEEAAEIVHSHHEQPDGKGYPRGLRSDEILLGSRIIMVVAAFDAMTSDRPYRRGLAPEAAFEELLACSGTQFSADVVEALIELYTAGTLFDEFEESQLTQYAEGQCSSRALEDFVNRRGGRTTVPEKVCLEKDGEAAVIPMQGEEVRFEENEYDLSPGMEGKLQVAAASGVGCSRENNEDNFGIFGEENGNGGVLLVLADGMGGEAAGEVASAMAVDTVQSAYYAAMEKVNAPEALTRALELANQAIFTEASSNHSLQGMGTTCTAAAFVDGEVIMGHVGDSRAYLVAGNEMTMLTRDHTLAAELSEITGTEGAEVLEGASNVLTRCLGRGPEFELDAAQDPIGLAPGDIVVLCSDGLSNMVHAEEIQQIVSEHSPAEACRRLVDLAEERGGPDNITVQVARVAA